MNPAGDQRAACLAERSEGPAVDFANPAPGRSEPNSPMQDEGGGDQSVGLSTSFLNRAHIFYKAALSPWLHTFGLTGSCRFQPTCSEYAAVALAQYGPVRGTWLGIKRLIRCQPLSHGGWDPVPPANGQIVPRGTICSGSAEKVIPARWPQE